MSKKTKFKNYFYKINPTNVSIWYSPKESIDLEFYMIKPEETIEYFKKNSTTMTEEEIVDLFTPTKEDVEKYLLKVEEDIDQATKANEAWKKQLKEAKPKFKVGDHIVYNLSYATVLYKITEIKNSEGPFYQLQGLRILTDDGSNPYKMEARSYNPFCGHFDNITENGPRLVEGSELEELLKCGTPV